MPYVETEPPANTTGHPAVMAARASSDAASAKTTCTRAGEDRSRTEKGEKLENLEKFSITVDVPLKKSIASSQRYTDVCVLV